MATTTHVHPAVAGFSLIELLITLSVAAIVLGISAPALQGFAARQALISASNSLVTGLQLARATAITSNRAVRLCPSRNGLQCEDMESWSVGWRTASERLPHSTLAQDSLPAGIQVRSSAGRPYVRYLPDGRSAGSNASLTLCSGGKHWRQIIVNNGGRVRQTPIQTTACPL